MAACMRMSAGTHTGQEHWVPEVYAHECRYPHRTGALGSLKLELCRAVSHLMYLKMKSGSLEKPQVLLPTERSPQPQ